MIELKVQCDCGQKYKFDVEPVNGLMPFRVNCPICGLDGTEKANLLLQAQAPVPVAAAFAPPPPVPAGLRLGVAAPPVAAAVPPMPAAQRFPRPGIAAAPRKVAETSNLALGALGALIGAAVGAGLMYGFFLLTDFRFPLLGTGVGALTGLGARILYKGTDSALGAISGGLAAFAVVGVLYMIYHEFPIFNIVSVLVSVSVAYKVAA